MPPVINATTPATTVTVTRFIHTSVAKDTCDQRAGGSSERQFASTPSDIVRSAPTESRKRNFVPLGCGAYCSTWCETSPRRGRTMVTGSDEVKVVPLVEMRDAISSPAGFRKYSSPLSSRHIGCTPPARETANRVPVEGKGTTKTSYRPDSFEL